MLRCFVEAEFYMVLGGLMSFVCSKRGLRIVFTVLIDVAV